MIKWSEWRHVDMHFHESVLAWPLIDFVAQFLPRRDLSDPEKCGVRDYATSARKDYSLILPNAQL